MTKRKKMTLVTIIETVLLLAFVGVAIFVAINLRPVTFTASDGQAVAGWRWGGRVYIDANAFSYGMDAELDIEDLSITFTQPVDPQQVKADAEEAMTLQFDKAAEEIRREHEDAIAALEKTIEGLEAQLAQIEETASGNGGTTRAGSSPSGGNSQGGSTGGGTAGTQTQAPEVQAPPADTPPAPQATPPAPAPAPEPLPPAPTVDAGACIAEARAYALSLGLTEDGSLNTGNSGYLNPPDITALSQASVISDLKHCINVYHSYSPDDPSLVHFNIIQSGNLIYVLYQ